MKTRLPNITLAAFLLLSQLATGSAGAAIPNGYQQFDQWLTHYMALGLLPTPKEIRSKRDSLQMTAEEAEAAYQTDVANADNREAAGKHLDYLNLSGNVAIVTRDSKSMVTRQLGVQLNDMQVEYLADREHRAVDECAKTFAAIIGLTQKVGERIDSERAIEAIEIRIQSLKGAQQETFVKAVGSSLTSFYQKEEDPEFDSKPWIEELLATRVNPGIRRINAENGIAPKLSPEEAHAILD